MRKIAVLLLIFIGTLNIGGKTTYIPTYSSYIYLQQGNDSTIVSNIKASLELESFDKLFTISVHHEEMSEEKVKSIKRSKAKAGWSTFNTVMSVLAPGQRGTIFSRIQDVRQSAKLLKMDKDNANAEKVLGIEIWVENNSDKELIVNDMIRGLAWYIRPKESIQFEISNPEVARLRVSDIENKNIQYATICVGSSVRKENLAWEDNDCWIIYEYIDYPSKINYTYISKDDFSTRALTLEEKRRVEKFMQTSP